MESNFDFERKIKERTNKTFTGVIYKYTSPSNKVYIGQTTDEEMRKYRFKTSVNYGGLKIDNARKNMISVNGNMRYWLKSITSTKKTQRMI